MGQVRSDYFVAGGWDFAAAWTLKRGWTAGWAWTLHRTGALQCAWTKQGGLKMYRAKPGSPASII